MCAEIVSLAERRARQAHPVLAQMEAYWDGLRNGRDCPYRAEVRPQGLTGILGHTFILEKIAPGIGRFRVTGRYLTEVARIELKGLQLATLFLPDARDPLEEALDRVFTGPTALRLFLKQAGESAAKPIGGQMLLLPMRDDLGYRTRVLGCLAMDRIAPGRPGRMDIEGMSERPIVTGGAGQRPGNPAPRSLTGIEDLTPSGGESGADIVPLQPD